MILDANGCYSCQGGNTEMGVLEGMTRKINVDVLILDGYDSDIPTKDLVSAVFQVPRVQETRKGVIVQSVAAGLILESFAELRRAVRIFEVGPWTLDSYVQSCLNNDFFKSVQPNLEESPLSEEIVSQVQVKSLIEENFYYAGGSARWMFDYTVWEIQDRVQRMLLHFDNLKEGTDQRRVQSTCS